MALDDAIYKICVVEHFLLIRNSYFVIFILLS